MSLQSKQNNGKNVVGVSWQILARLIVTAMLVLAAYVEVHAEPMDVRPTVRVRPVVMVKGSVITLGEIASISNASRTEFNRVVATLKQIQLGDAPPPRVRTTITGAKVLAAIEAAGITADSIGYSLPATIEIERSGLVLTPGDILPAVQESFRNDTTLDVQVREVSWSSAQAVPTGTLRYEIERLGDPQGGKIPLRISVLVDEAQAARFLATAVVDDWREIPVLNKTLERGMLIQSTDIEMVRLNLFKQPLDVVDRSTSVVGLRAKARLGAGTAIRKALIDIPPIIPQGKKVTMIFKQGGLQATATGVAMEDGFEDSEIRLKNDNSRKVVKAKVLNENEVRVSGE